MDAERGVRSLSWRAQALMPIRGARTLVTLGLLVALAQVPLGCHLGDRGQSSPSTAPTAAPSQTAGSPTGAPGTNGPTAKPTKTPKASAGTTTPPTEEPATSGPTQGSGEHPNWPAGAITSAAAKTHVGQRETVCGTVVAANWAADAPGLPTFLNLDAAWPHPRFNILIWGEQRGAFPSPKPELSMLHHQACVTGVIVNYKTWQQIEGSIDSVQKVPGS
jgi:hypothetical protein